MREEGTLVRLEQRKVLSKVSTNIARFSLLYFVFFLKLPNESSTNAYNKQINNNNNQIVVLHFTASKLARVVQSVSIASIRTTIAVAVVAVVAVAVAVVI